MTLVLIMLIAAGVPLFAVVALAVLLAYGRAELEFGLVMMEFMNLAAETQLLAVPMLAVAAVFLRQRHLDPVRALMVMHAARIRQGGGPVAWLTGGMLVIAAVATAALIAAVPALLYSTFIGLIAPRQAVAAEMLVVGLFVPLLLLGGLYLLFASRRGYALMLGSADAAPPSTGGPKLMPWLPLPVLLLGAVASGWLTLFEMALLLLLGSVATTLFDRQPRGRADFSRLAITAIGSSASILLLLGLSMVWSAMLNDSGMVLGMIAHMGLVTAQSGVFMLVALMVLVAVGAVLGINAGLLLLVPLIVPLGLAAAVDALHLGVVMLAGLLVGCGAGMHLGLRPGSRGMEARENPAGGSEQGVAYLPLAALTGLLLIAGLPVFSLWLPGLFSL
jgi:hypothetical protein